MTAIHHRDTEHTEKDRGKGDGGGWCRPAAFPSVSPVPLW